MAVRLSPLPDRDARTVALERLRDFLLLTTFRRTVAPGQPSGQAFRLKEHQIHLEQPSDAGGEADLPSIAFLPLPGPGVHDTAGMGPMRLLDETFGLYGEDTAVVRFGEYVEPFTVEVVAAHTGHRRGLVAGLEAVFRLVAESQTLRLTLPRLFGSIANFELTGTRYFEDPLVAQNRRRAHLNVTMTVSDVWIAQGVARLDPRVLLEVGTEVEFDASPAVAL